MKRTDFLRAQRGGSGVRSRSFVLVAHRREDEHGARLGLVASRKVGNSVERNRAKRLVRDWFRRCWRKLPPSGDLVVILRRAAHEVTSQALWRELDQAAQKAGTRFPGLNSPEPALKVTEPS